MRRAIIWVAVLLTGCGQKEEPSLVVVSDEGTIAQVVKSGKEEKIVVDDKRVGPAVEKVKEMIFVPRTTALNGAPGGENVAPAVVAAVKTEGKEQVMKDGEAVGPKHDELGPLLVTKTGNVVVLFRTGDEWAVETNGAVADTERYGAVSEVQVSDDGQATLVQGMDKAGRRVVRLNGKDVMREREYGTPGTSVLSPNGRSVAFATVACNGWVVVRDGLQVGERYPAVGQLVFSPDSISLACVVGTGGKTQVVVNGIPIGGWYDSATTPVFSRDSRSIVFVASADGKQRVIKDGTPVGDAYQSVWGLALSWDGGSVAFGAALGTERFMVKDGVGVNGDWEGVGRPLFSPSGRSLAFAAWKGERWFLVKDGQVASGQFEGIHSIATNKEGTQIVLATIRRGKIVRVQVPW